MHPERSYAQHDATSSNRAIVGRRQQALTIRNVNVQPAATIFYMVEGNADACGIVPFLSRNVHTVNGRHARKPFYKNHVRGCGLV